jgi:ferredoxin
MIVAVRKPLPEIEALLAPHRSVVLLGCRGCVTVCNAGGEKEVGVLAATLALARQARGEPFDPREATVERQCDPEYVDPLGPALAGVDAVLSLACGAGVQFVAERHPRVRVFPALNTVFVGVTEAAGKWAERCQACGDCKVGRTAGVCPVARCSKSLLNGPCGGSKGGACEIDPAVPCGWALIVERLEARGELARYEEFVPANDWRTGRDGGPRRAAREELT